MRIEPNARPRRNEDVWSFERRRIQNPAKPVKRVTQFLSPRFEILVRPNSLDQLFARMAAIDVQREVREQSARLLRSKVDRRRTIGGEAKAGQEFDSDG